MSCLPNRNVPSATVADDAPIMERRLREAAFEDSTSSKAVFSIVRLFRLRDMLTDLMQDYTRGIDLQKCRPLAAASAPAPPCGHTRRYLKTTLRMMFTSQVRRDGKELGP